MRIKTITCFEAKDLIPRDNCALISINESYLLYLIQNNWNNLLRLCFDDINPEIYEKIRNIEKFKNMILFNEDHAKVIIHFLNTLHEEVDILYIHCAADASRSPAVGRFAAEILNVTDFDFGYNDYNHYVYNLLWKVKEELS
jgi:predicted protein tyrosine phosphatase